MREPYLTLAPHPNWNICLDAFAVWCSWTKYFNDCNLLPIFSCIYIANAHWSWNIITWIVESRAIDFFSRIDISFILTNQSIIWKFSYSAFEFFIRKIINNNYEWYYSDLQAFITTSHWTFIQCLTFICAIVVAAFLFDIIFHLICYLMGYISLNFVFHLAQEFEN